MLPRFSAADDPLVLGRAADTYKQSENPSMRTIASSAANTNFLGSSSAVQRPAAPGGDAFDTNTEIVDAEASPQAGYHRPIQRQALPEPLPPPSLFPRRQGSPLMSGMLFEWHLTPQDRARILEYLRLGHLSVGSGLQSVFNGRPTTVDAVIDLARGWVLNAIPRSEVAGVVHGVWSPMLLDTLTRIPPPPPPPVTIPLPEEASGAPAAAPEDDLQASLGAQWTWHLTKRAPSEGTVQVQLAQGSGALQRVYSFSLNLTTGDVQAMAGVQLQRDTPTVGFLRGVLKATAFVQLVAGITRASGEASGAITFQVQAGVQATATWGPVTVTAGLAPTLTLLQRQAPALDLNAFGQGGQSSVVGPPGGTYVPIISGRF